MDKNILITELSWDILNENKKTFFETLSNLKDVGNINEEQAKNILSRIISQDGHIFVALHPKDGIVSCLTLLIEQKFIRKGAKAAHIEDVSTRKGFEGQGLSSALMKKAISFAKEQNCYKVILDCENELEKFYRKYDFVVDGSFMRKYLND